MKRRQSDLGSIFRGGARWVLYILTFLTPLFFLPTTLDTHEPNKQALVAALVSLTALFWVGSMLADKAVTLRRGWINIFPVFLLIGVMVSAFGSQGKYLSWIGASMQEYTSVLTLALLVAMFYLVVNLITDEVSRRRLRIALLSSGILVSIIALISISGIFMSEAFSRGFNTIGSPNALGIFLASVSSLAMAAFLVSKTKIEQIVAVLTVIFAVFELIMIDDWAPWIVLLAGLSIVVGVALLRSTSVLFKERMILPALVGLIALIFLSFVPSPWVNRMPVEVTPSFGTSWNVAIDSLHDTSYLIGSGAGTYVFDFVKFRPLELNETNYWNTRFDRGASFFVTVLATEGILGIFVWLLILIATVITGIGTLLEKNGNSDKASNFAALSGFVALMVSFFIYGLNMTLIFLLFLMIGLVVSSSSFSKKEYCFKTSPKAGLTFSFVFGAVIIALVSLSFLSIQRYTAETSMAAAIRADGARKPIEDVIGYLDDSAKRNRFSDATFRSLSDALLIRLEEILNNTDKSEITSTETKKIIPALIAASVNASIKATELSPNNVLNWKVRGVVYRRLANLFEEAESMSVKAFERAIELEPNNPENHVELGRAFLISAEVTREGMTSEDRTVRAKAEVEVQTFLAKAEAEFNKAIELKSDFASAHFQLGLVFEQQGRIEDAINKMISVAKYNPSDAGVQFQLGLLYMRRGAVSDLELSAASFKQAITLEPSFSNARWFLASVYEQQGNLEAAIGEIVQVLTRNPEDELVKARLTRLEAGIVNKELPEPMVEGVIDEVKDTATES